LTQVHHKCLICGSLIIQQPQSMKGHLTMHQLTLEDYFFKFVVAEFNAQQQLEIESQKVTVKEVRFLK
jgi:hypothetical protein